MTASPTYGVPNACAALVSPSLLGVGVCAGAKAMRQQGTQFGLNLLLGATYLPGLYVVFYWPYCLFLSGARFMLAPSPTLFVHMPGREEDERGLEHHRRRLRHDLTDLMPNTEARKKALAGCLLEARAVGAICAEDKGEGRSLAVAAFKAAQGAGLTPSNLAPMSVKRSAENLLKFRG